MSKPKKPQQRLQLLVPSAADPDRHELVACKPFTSERVFFSKPADGLLMPTTCPCDCMDCPWWRPAEEVKP